MNISGPKPNSQHVLGLLKCFRKFLPYFSRDVFHVLPSSHILRHYIFLCFFSTFPSNLEDDSDFILDNFGGISPAKEEDFSVKEKEAAIPKKTLSNGEPESVNITPLGKAL